MEASLSGASSGSGRAVGYREVGCLMLEFQHLLVSGAAASLRSQGSLVSTMGGSLRGLFHVQDSKMQYIPIIQLKRALDSELYPNDCSNTRARSRCSGLGGDSEDNNQFGN